MDGVTRDGCSLVDGCISYDTLEAQARASSTTSELPEKSSEEYPIPKALLRRHHHLAIRVLQCGWPISFTRRTSDQLSYNFDIGPYLHLAPYILHNDRVASRLTTKSEQASTATYTPLAIQMSFHTRATYAPDDHLQCRAMSVVNRGDMCRLPPSQHAVFTRLTFNKHL